jgi:hypothetical protein
MGLAFLQGFLQWGNGLLTLRAKNNLKSATALPPWMTSYGRSAVLLADQLQFGHGVAAVDGKLRIFSVRHLTQAEP